MILTKPRKPETTVEGLWPRQPLTRIPGRDGAEALADRVRRWIGATEDQPIDLDQVCALANAKATKARLSAAEGMEEALLIPLDGDRFSIAVDPIPPGGWGRIPAPLRCDVEEHRFRFRVAHELGHVFAYSRRPSQRPERHLFDSAAQEEFCDHFAGALLVPPAAARRAEPSARGVLDLQQAYNVSLEVAGRALADAQSTAVIVWFEREPGEFMVQWASRPPDSGELKRALRLGHGEDPAAHWFAERRQLVLVGPA